MKRRVNMSEKKWLSFQSTSEVNEPPKIEVNKAVTSSAAPRARSLHDVEQHKAVTVRYTISGAWEGTVADFKRLEIPETTFIDVEGAPSVPKDGIFVALPMDAEDVQVRVVEKSTTAIDRELEIAPAPKQFIESEFKEVYKPDPSIYGSDEPYPGRDFDFLGLKTVAGVKVAHILVYLGQYRPVSKSMEVVQSIVLEVSYHTPHDTDSISGKKRSARKLGRKPRQMPETDLILGLDLLDDQADYSSIIEDFEGLDREFIEKLEAEAELPPDELDKASYLETTEDEVLITSAPVERSLTARRPTAFPRPKLKIAGLIAEYVIITTRALENAVEPLRRAKTGWPFYAKVALTEDIQKEFPHSGSDLKESIKAFITWATNNWWVPPRFVVLAGDTDVIPMHTYERGYLSDHYYTDVSDDLVPELALSRIPTSDPAVLKQVCRHLTGYANRRRGDWGGWQNRVMLCSHKDSVYRDNCDEIYDRIHHRYNTIKRYATDTSRQDVINTMNNGVVMALYRGHGDVTEWSSSNGLRCEDVEQLSNGCFPPFVLSVCCSNGAVDFNHLETITETFIRRRKAISVFASSRDSWTHPNNDFARYLLDAVISGKCATPAAIVRYAKTMMIRNHPNSVYHMDNMLMYNLFGELTAHVASNAEWLRGRWEFLYDKWKGTLKVDRIWNYRVETSPSGLQAPVWSISGQYVNRNHSYSFEGTLGGFSPAQPGVSSVRSDHKFEFRIKFSSSYYKRFVGYVDTCKLTRISGSGWEFSYPFGWTAQRKKRRKKKGKRKAA